MKKIKKNFRELVTGDVVRTERGRTDLIVVKNRITTYFIDKKFIVRDAVIWTSEDYAFIGRAEIKVNRNK